MGTIIGRSGLKIKHIQDVSGVRMVAQKEMLPQSTERIVEVQGTPEGIERQFGKLANAWSMTGSEAREPFSTTLPFAPRLALDHYLQWLVALELEKAAMVVEADPTTALVMATTSASPGITATEQPRMPMRQLVAAESQWSPKMARKFRHRISAYPPTWLAASLAEGVPRSARSERAPVHASRSPKHHMMRLESACSLSWVVNRQMRKRYISCMRISKPRKCVEASSLKNKWTTHLRNLPIPVDSQAKPCTLRSTYNPSASSRHAPRPHLKSDC